MGDGGFIQSLGRGLTLAVSRDAGGPIRVEVKGAFTNESWPMVARAVTEGISRVAKESGDEPAPRN